MTVAGNSRNVRYVSFLVLVVFTLSIISFFLSQLKLLKFRNLELNDTTFGISVKQQELFDERVIVIVPPIGSSIAPRSKIAVYELDMMEKLLYSLTNAVYTTKVSLNLLLAPESNSSAFDVRYSVAKKTHWSHGEMYVTNATSNGSFEMILSVWTTQRNARERIVLIDAALAGKLNFDWFETLQAARARYGDIPDVAAFAISSMPNHVHSAVTKRSSIAEPFVSGKNSNDGVRLYQLAAYVPILAPQNSEYWRLFQRWLTAHRAEWFLWPNVVNPKNLYDKEWKGFNARSRTHWTMWYSRFLAEHRMYIAFIDEIDSRVFSNESYEGSFDNLRRISFDGREHHRKTENNSATQEELDQIVQMARKADGKVAITVVTNAFLETAQSWICNVDVAGFRPSATVWIAPEESSYNFLRSVNGSRAIYMRSFKGGREKSGTDFLSPGYWLLMLERTRLIRDLLERGVGVFAFETDQIWLRDPVPTISRIMESGDGVDLVGTLDTRNQIAGNFLYVVPTLASRWLWREIAKRFSRAYYLAGLHLRHTADFRRNIENDQSLLTHLVFYDAEFKRQNPVVFRALDTCRFVDGRWYLGTTYYGRSALSPTIINNNFVIGIAKKKARAEKHGHWFLSNGECDAAKVLRAIQANDIRESAHGRSNSTYGSRAGLEGDFYPDTDKVIKGISKALIYV